MSRFLRGKNEVGKKRRKFRCSNECFKAHNGEAKILEIAVDDGGSLDVAAMPKRDQLPTHLVVTVNGFAGSSENWKFAAKQFVKRYPEDVIVHCSQSNHSLLTLDGVDVMGERLAEEVLAVVSKNPELRKISFVAHSLGGLISRYAIALLFKQNVPSKSDSEKLEENLKQDSGFQCLEQQSYRGRIAGLEPKNFITFVTPHLGSKWHKQSC